VRIYAFLILFVLVLAAPFALRAVLKNQVAPRAPAGAARLVVITPNNQDIRREFARAFSAWHQARFGQAVEIDFRVPGGTNDIKRQLATTYASWRGKDGSLDPRFVPDVDVVWGGGDYFLNNEIKPLGILQPMHLDPALLAAVFPEPAIAGVALYDRTTDAGGTPTPQWVGICLSAFGILYNPDVYRGLGLPEPTQWHDLTDARLAGQLSLADPTHSGSAATAYMVILQRRMVDAEEALLQSRPDLKNAVPDVRAKDPAYGDAVAAGLERGMAELQLIAANARYFTDSSSQVPADIGNGDAAAGISIDFYGRVYEELVGTARCRMITPVGATAITPDPVGILDGVRGERLTLSMRFVEFLLSPEGQRIWVLRPGSPGGPVERALRRMPVRQDLYADQNHWSDRINLFKAAHGFNQRADVFALFVDTRPVWTAAWIDSGESMKSAYRAVLAVPDAARRAELLDEFAKSTVSLNDIVAARDERKKREQAGNADQWKAERRIELAKTFRRHFTAVKDKAR
jgi:ABC-type Fe3+ transport system substrate-binding protein